MDFNVIPMLGAQITAPELHSLLGSLPADSIIIDVRTPEEFAKGAIASAKNLPVDEILTHEAELTPYKNIYLYCLSGGRSQLALAQLSASLPSSNLYSLTSGLLAWRKEGFLLITA